MSEPDNEFAFIWLDEDGVRCSPRHRTLRAAVAFRKDQSQRWTREDGQAKLVDYQVTWPSQKKPAKLVIGQWILRDPDPQEQAKVDAVIALMEEGYV